MSISPINSKDLSPELKCRECNKEFCSRCTLARHEITHSGLRHFKCPYCSYKAKRSDHLTSHLRRIHVHNPNKKFRNMGYRPRQRVFNQPLSNQFLPSCSSTSSSCNVQEVADAGTSNEPLRFESPMPVISTPSENGESMNKDRITISKDSSQSVESLKKRDEELIQSKFDAATKKIDELQEENFLMKKELVNLMKQLDSLMEGNSRIKTESEGSVFIKTKVEESD